MEERGEWLNEGWKKASVEERVRKEQELMNKEHLKACQYLQKSR